MEQIKPIEQIINESGINADYYQYTDLIKDIIYKWIKQKIPLYPKDENAIVVFNDLIEELK
jgi:hypothetical protein